MIITNEPVLSNRDRIKSSYGMKPIDVKAFGTKVIVAPILIEPIAVKGTVHLLKSRNREGAYEEYDCHPFQGIVVALGEKVPDTSIIALGNLVYSRSKANHTMMFNKVLYNIFDVSDIVCSIPKV